MPAAFRWFLGATFLSQLGNAVALLAATIVSSDAGAGAARSATFTALMLALNFGTSTVTTPYAAALAARTGARQLYGYGQLASASIYALIAVGILAGLPGYPLLLVSAPVLGAIGGCTHTVSPVTLRAYSGNEDLASAESQSATATGFAWVIGSLAGAGLVHLIGAPAAFFANFLLTLPLAWVALRVRPTADVPAIPQQRRPWHTMAEHLRKNPAVRRAAGLGLVASVLVAPLASMVVPITRDLGHNLAVHAGLILACIAVGEMLSPAAVSAMGRTGKRVSPTWLAYAVAGLVLVVMGLTAIALDGGPELIGLAAFGVVYGAVNYGGTSFLVRDAAAYSSDDDRQADLAAFFIVSGIGIPVGTLLWGQLIHLLPAGRLLLFAGAAMVAFVVALLIARAEYRHRHHGHDLPTHPAGFPMPHGILRRLGT